MPLDVDLTKKLAIIFSFSATLTAGALFFGNLKNKIEDQERYIDRLESRVTRDIDRLTDAVDLNESRITSNTLRNNGQDARIKRLEDKEG